MLLLNTKYFPCRLKSVEPLLPMLSAVDYETKFDRKKSPPSQVNTPGDLIYRTFSVEKKKSKHFFLQLSKTNAQYHKLFKEVGKDEPLRQSKCHEKCLSLTTGSVFIPEFLVEILRLDKYIAIPVLSVTFLKKTKTALLVPNALVIETHVFVSFLSRNTTFKLLKSICNHLEVNATLYFPVISCPSPLPLNFSGDLSDLDGVVQQRRQEMMESSSSGSQTPDSDKMTVLVQ
uniref:GRAM domain-containing protein n=1 Tax=Periophthalmus magnuspinnatus TaxID=409849 RepID=A0A3B4AWJ8_9GOBI